MADPLHLGTEGTSAAPAAVEVRGLAKSYGSRRVVDDLSFAVQRGEIFALLGPNGAGKTTTVEILEGYRKPDAGSVAVLGCDPWTEGRALKPRIGVMLQEGGPYPSLTVAETLALFARFYPRHRPTEEIIDLVGLRDVAGTRYRLLSGGQKQRLSLGLALIGEPDVVFLDEPTAGLDPQARRATWDIVTGLRRDGVSVILTTHYLEEAEQLADRVAILSGGALAALGSPDELVRSDRPVVWLRTAREVPPAILRPLPTTTDVRAAGPCRYEMKTEDPARLLVEVATRLRDLAVPILELRVGGGTLEDVYLRLVGDEVDS